MAEAGQIVIEPSGEIRVREPNLLRWLAARAGEWRIVPVPGRILMFERVGESNEEDDKGVTHWGRIVGLSDVTDMVTVIQSSRWTGVLHVSSGSTHKKICFEDGDVRGAGSNSPEDRLGEVLCRYGALTREQLRASMGQVTSQLRLGTVLVRDKLLTQHDLYKYARRQVEEMFFSLLMLKEGEFYFVRMTEADHAWGQVRLSTQNLMFQGLQRIDEMGYFRQKIASSSAVLERVDGASKVSIEVVEQQVLDLVDGVRDLKDIATRSRLGEFEATKAAFKLLQSGQVRIHSEGGMGLLGRKVREKGLMDVATVFNDAFTQIFAEIVAQSREDEFRQAVQSFFAGSTDYGTLFQGVKLEDDGALSADILLENAGRIQTDDPVNYLYQGLNEFLFFEMFVAGETLDETTEQRLQRRLEEVLQAMNEEKT